MTGCSTDSVVARVGYDLIWLEMYELALFTVEMSPLLAAESL